LREPFACSVPCWGGNYGGLGANRQRNRLL
jgi:hypothetical protein